jgi:carbonic anhydrase
MAGHVQILVAVLAAALASSTLVAAPWHYEGAAGPAHWADVDPGFKACAIGTEQSPIDLAGRDVAAGADGMRITWAPGAFKIVNNGHTIEAEAPAGSTVTLGGHAFTLEQFHFHLPSEHVTDGRHAAMEVHFVHKDAAGKVVVVAVMMKPGAANPLFHAVMAAAPATANAPEREARLDPRGLLPKTRARYRYEGSLTTPPCSEVVDWQVLATPVTVAAADIERFHAIIGDNARPVQPRGRRFVLKVPG